MAARLGRATIDRQDILGRYVGLKQMRRHQDVAAAGAPEAQRKGPKRITISSRILSIGQDIMKRSIAALELYGSILAWLTGYQPSASLPQIASRTAGILVPGSTTPTANS